MKNIKYINVVFEELLIDTFFTINDEIEKNRAANNGKKLYLLNILAEGFTINKTPNNPKNKENHNVLVVFSEKINNPPRAVKVALDRANEVQFTIVKYCNEIIQKIFPKTPKDALIKYHFFISDLNKGVNLNGKYIKAIIINAEKAFKNRT